MAAPDHAPAPPRPGGRRAEAEANDGRVLDAARDLLTRNPDATMAAIATHAGVGVGSLYRRFPSKGDLARRLCLDGMHAITAAAEDARADASLDEWETLRRFAHDAIDAGAGSLRGLAGSFEADDEVMEATNAMSSHMDSLFADAEKAGSTRAGASPYDVGLMFEMARSISLASPERNDALRHRYLDVMLDGLRAGAPGELPAPAPTWREIVDSWS